jgi:hypothetical protein
MTGSEKAYSAPRLETLSLRETRLHIGIGAGININLPILGGGGGGGGGLFS